MPCNEIESAHVINVSKRNCIGILHHASGSVGVLIVVGGPQYRVGSHRQYVKLSRKLAKVGIPSFRFDVRGMGDSVGEKQPFHQLDEDIREALTQFEQLSGLRKFVIMGLCDAASASWMYAWKDKRIVGQILINPWLKNPSAQGQVMLKHYYPYRLLSLLFWKKLLTGNVSLVEAIKDAVGYSKRALSNKHSADFDFESKMKAGANKFQGRVCLVLSGQDLTAREFEQVTKFDDQWQAALSANIETHHFSNADHTFSDPMEEKRLHDTIISFLRTIPDHNLSV